MKKDNTTEKSNGRKSDDVSAENTCFAPKLSRTEFLKKLALDFPRRYKPLMHYIGVACILKPERLTPYPAILREYGLRRRGYGGYRILLAPFSGQYSKVEFRGLGDGKEVVCGYIVDKQGNIESFAVSPQRSDGYTVLPLTSNSYALYASLPMKSGLPLWDNITVRLTTCKANGNKDLSFTETDACFLQNVAIPLVH